jgi:surfactin synthase thioesterase subunit
VGASVFRTWPADLPPEIEVCAVEYPGRGSRLREVPCRRLTDLAERASAAIAAQAELPFAIFGHSLGALVAFDVVRQLRRRGAPLPLHLFVSGRRPPQVPDPGPLLFALPEAEFVEGVRRRYDGIPDVVLQEPELLRLLLPAMRADFEALETYAYAPELPLDIPVSVFGGEEDPCVPVADLAGWKDQTSGACTVLTYPGSHFFIQSARTAFLSALGRETQRLVASDVAVVHP